MSARFLTSELVPLLGQGSLLTEIDGPHGPALAEPFLERPIVAVSALVEARGRDKQGRAVLAAEFARRDVQRVAEPDLEVDDSVGPVPDDFRPAKVRRVDLVKRVDAETVRKRFR